MIKEDKVLVPINIRNISFFRKRGYGPDILNKTIEVKIDDVNINSKIRITAICQICSSENNISISKYYKNKNRQGFYSCFDCKNKKKEITCIEKYGVKSFSQTSEFVKKYEETSLMNYGVSNPNKSKLIREKIKKTNIEKYGLSTVLIREDNIEKNREWMSSQEFRDKSKETIMKKYGTDSFSKTDEFKKIISEKKEIIIKKICETFMRKYGVNYISQSEMWTKAFNNKLYETEKKKIKTCMKKYGVDNVSKVAEFILKTKNKKESMGLSIPDCQISEWNLYKRKARNLTTSKKKELYENWNGLDYYDNELIIGYIGYNHTHRFYPTIDHKISIFYGYKTGIAVEEICSMENLCITKRYINCMKNSIIESEFNLPQS